MVEIAVDKGQHKPSVAGRQDGSTDPNGVSASAAPLDQEEEELRRAKKRSRLIIRNISFYAKESDLRASMSAYGQVIELSMPLVTLPESEGKKKKGKAKKQHRGFGFVTFSTVAEAQRAVGKSEKGEVEIKGRKVAVDWCTPKGVHKRGVERGEEQEKEDEEGGSGSDSDSDSDSSNDDEEAGSSEGSGDDS